MYDAFWAADYVVTVGKEAGHVGGGVWGYVEDVPNVFGGGEEVPLEGDAQGWVVCRDRDVKGADTLALIVVSTEGDSKYVSSKC